MTKEANSAPKLLGPVSREYTIHLKKFVHKVQFKKRAPRAIRSIKKFIEREMRTEDVRIDNKLNKFIWSNGIRNVPTRVRVCATRCSNSGEDGTKTWYTVVHHVPVETYKGLQTKVIS